MSTVVSEQRLTHETAALVVKMVDHLGEHLAVLSAIAARVDELEARLTRLEHELILDVGPAHD